MLFRSRPGGCRYSTITCNRGTTHSKYLLTEWQKADGTQVRHVFTGSHNITGPALRNHDETLVKIEHPTVWNDFHANFETLWSRAKCVNPDNGSCTT